MHLGIAYVLVSGAALLFIWCLCVAGGRADDDMDEALRRREQMRERAAESEIQGPPWRSR